MLLIYILLALLALAAIAIVALPFLLWRALSENTLKDDASAALPPRRLPSFYDKRIWLAFLSWRRDRPAQLEYHPGKQKPG